MSRLYNDMISYFQFQTIQLGPIIIQIWGTMVALGILIGAWTSAHYAERFGYKKERIYEIAFWVVLSAMIGARIFHVFVYEPAYYLAHPREIYAIWHGGFSVIGGFLGAIIAYAIYCYRHKINWLEYTDKVLYGLPLGLGCGRIGCFLIHDHPGTATDFFLGVKNPDGQGAFHDHGLYLSINGFLMALLFFYLAGKNRPRGFFAQVFLIWYGAVRFFLDFYRLIDTTYLGLTPAQYGSLMMFFSGLAWMLFSNERLKQKLSFFSQN